MTDAELLKRFTADGDEAAFRALAGRHSGLVYHTALRSTADPETAREVCQSVLLLLAQKSARLDASRGLAGWLHRTATLQARNARRGESRRQRALLAMRQHPLSNSAPSSASSPEGLADSFHPALPHLDEAVERLPERDREVLLAHYYTGRTYREIAEMRRETEAAVQRRASRALEKLAVSLRRQGLAVPTLALAAGLSGALQAPAPAGLVPLPLDLPLPTPAPASLPEIWTMAGRAAALVIVGTCAAAAGYALAAAPSAVAGRQKAAGPTKLSVPPGGPEKLRPLEVVKSGPSGDWQKILAEAARDLRNTGDPLAKARASWRLSAVPAGEFGDAFQWAAALPKEDAARERLLALVLCLQAAHDPVKAWAAFGTLPVKGYWYDPADSWHGTLFVRLWDRDPAACLAALPEMKGRQQPGAGMGERLIQESAPDRARWMKAVEQSPDVEIRVLGASATVRWAKRNPDMLGGVFDWALSLPFSRAEWETELNRPAFAEINKAANVPWTPLRRLIASLSWEADESEPAFSEWLNGLKGDQATKARHLLLTSMMSRTDDERLKLAKGLKDSGLREALLKSL
ncbi:MAG: RNA polymerase sigma factor [Verrucomicrobiota bacterium]